MLPSSYAGLLLLLFRHHWHRWLVLGAFSVVLALVNPLQVVLTKGAVDSVVSMISSSSGLELALRYLALQALLSLLAILVQQWREVLLVRTQERISLGLKTALLNKLSGLELLAFDDPNFQDKLRRANSAATAGVLPFDSIFAFVQLLLNLISYAVILGSAYPTLLLIIPLVAAMRIISGTTQAKRAHGSAVEATQLSRRIMYFDELLTARHAAQETRIFGTAGYFIGQYRLAYRKESERRLQVMRDKFTSSFRVTLIHQLSLFGVAAWLLWLTGQLKWSLGYYAALTQAISSVQSTTQEAATRLTETIERSLQVKDFLEIVNIPTKEVSAQDLTIEPLDSVNSIQVRDLTFQYPGSDRCSLKNINFEVGLGQVIALVGQSGSGKTTLAKCLAGLYLPQRGSVHYDGVALTSLSRRSIYASVGALFQDFIHYQLTARHNIGLGRYEILRDDARLWEAARRANIDQVLDSLPDGLDTNLGTMFGQPRQLSFGQWQRLALSRVFLKDAPIVILDEPTAALDPEAEAEVFRRVLEEYKGKKIVFLVSHRLGVCTAVDQILVLKDGRLVESGSHTDLVNAGGEYARLFRLQAGMYLTNWA